MRKKESKRPLGTAPGLCAVYRHAANARAGRRAGDGPDGTVRVVSSEVSEETEITELPYEAQDGIYDEWVQERERTWATEKSVRLQMEDCT